MTDQAVIRTAEPADLDGLLALEVAGFDEASRWSRDSWAAEFAGGDRCVLVAECRSGGSEPDPAELVGVATFQLVADVADLLRVMVAPEHRRHGIGRGLIEAGLAWVEERRVGRVLLEVEHGNAPALALYRRLGFTELARRKDYYGAGRHALVMQRTTGTGRDHGMES